MDVIRAILVWTTFIQTICVEWIKQLPDAASSFTRTISMGPPYPVAAVTQPPLKVLLLTHTAASARRTLEPIAANISFDDFLQGSTSAYIDYSTHLDYKTTDLPLGGNGPLATWTPDLNKLLTVAICCCALLLYRYRPVLRALMAIVAAQPKPRHIPEGVEPLEMTTLIYSFHNVSDLYSDGAKGYAARSQANHLEIAAFWDSSEALQGKLDQRDQEIEHLRAQLLDESNIHAVCEFFKDQELRSYRSREKSTGMRLAESSTPAFEGEESHALIRGLKFDEMVDDLQAAIAKKLGPSSEVQEENKKLSDSKTALQKALGDLHGRFTALEREKEQQQQSIEQLERDARLAAQENATMTQLQQKASEDATIISDLRLALSRAQTEAATLSGQIADEKENGSKALRELTDSMKSRTATYEARLEQVNGVKDRAVDTLEQANTAKDDELAVVRRKIAELEAENDDISMKLGEAQEAASQAELKSICPLSQAAPDSFPEPSSEQHESQSFRQPHDALATHVSRACREIAAKLEKSYSLSLCTYCRSLIYDDTCLNTACRQKHMDAQQMVSEPPTTISPYDWIDDISFGEYTEEVGQVVQAPIGDTGAHQNSAIGFDDSSAPSYLQDPSQVFASGSTQGAEMTAAMPLSDAQDSIDPSSDSMEVDGPAGSALPGSRSGDLFPRCELCGLTTDAMEDDSCDCFSVEADAQPATGFPVFENVFPPTTLDTDQISTDQQDFTNVTHAATTSAPMDMDQISTDRQDFTSTTQAASASAPMDTDQIFTDQLCVTGTTQAGPPLPVNSQAGGVLPLSGNSNPGSPPTQSSTTPLEIQTNNPHPGDQTPSAVEEAVQHADDETLQNGEICQPKSLENSGAACPNNASTIGGLKGLFKPLESTFCPDLSKIYPLQGGGATGPKSKFDFEEKNFRCWTCGKAVSYIKDDGNCEDCVDRERGHQQPTAPTGLVVQISSQPDPKTSLRKQVQFGGDGAGSTPSFSFANAPPSEFKFEINPQPSNGSNSNSSTAPQPSHKNNGEVIKDGTDKYGAMRELHRASTAVSNNPQAPRRVKPAFSKPKTSSKAAAPSDSTASRNASTPNVPHPASATGGTNTGQGQASNATQGPPAGTQAPPPPPGEKMCQHCHKYVVGFNGSYCTVCFYENNFGRPRRR